MIKTVPGTPEQNSVAERMNRTLKRALFHYTIEEHVLFSSAEDDSMKKAKCYIFLRIMLSKK